jgi:hypothetical protein
MQDRPTGGPAQYDLAHAKVTTNARDYPRGCDGGPNASSNRAHRYVLPQFAIDRRRVGLDRQHTLLPLVSRAMAVASLSIAMLTSADRNESRDLGLTLQLHP